MRPTAAASAFGFSLVAHDVQSSGRPDLIVGAPERVHPNPGDGGAVQVLNSQGVNGLDGNQGGRFSGVDSADSTITVVAVESQSRLYLRSANPLALIYQEPTSETDPTPVTCLAMGDPAQATFNLRLALDYELGGGSDSLVFYVDNTGNFVPRSAIDNTVGSGEAFEITLDVSDSGFGDPTVTDTITLDIAQVRGWSGSSVVGFQDVNTFISGDPTITNNPGGGL